VQETSALTPCICRICGRGFLSREGVDYLLSRLRAEGIEGEELETRQMSLETCADCKRASHIHKKLDIGFRRFFKQR
jgi:hypothetical protein